MTPVPRPGYEGVREKGREQDLSLAAVIKPLDQSALPSAPFCQSAHPSL